LSLQNSTCEIICLSDGRQGEILNSVEKDIPFLSYTSVKLVSREKHLVSFPDSGYINPPTFHLRRQYPNHQTFLILSGWWQMVLGVFHLPDQSSSTKKLLFCFNDYENILHKIEQ